MLFRSHNGELAYFAPVADMPGFPRALSRTLGELRMAGLTAESIGGHAAIIDGYTAKGPLVVTWGHTYQMTWGEYWRSINSLRAITR